MEILNRLFYSLVGGGAIFYVVVKVSLSYWKKRGILHEKPKFFWGNLKGFSRKQHLSEILKNLYEKYKTKAPFIGFFAFLKPMLLILDLDLVYQILSLDAGFFMERGLYHNTEDDLLSENLMQLDGKKWSTLHEKVKCCFADDQLKEFLPALHQVAKNFTKSLYKLQQVDDTFDITHLIECYNIDVISYLVFGEQTNTLNDSKNNILALTKNFDRNISYKKCYFAWDFPNLAKILQCQLFDSPTTEQFKKIINDKLKDYEWNKNIMKNFNFLKLIMDQKRQRLNSNEISGQCFTFLLVGLKPSNITMSYCLYELALYPEIQTKVRNEIHFVMEKHGGDINSQMLDDLKYMKQVLYETLRKHSPYPAVVRKVSKDYEVPNSTFMLQEGNHLLIPVSAIHYDPDLYENPEKFDPDRFTPDNIKKRHPMAWLPFGKGTRGCLAEKFAEQAMLFGLMKLINNYEFIPCAETVTNMKYDISQILSMPKGVIKLKLKSLN